jgi:hypothetical protein
MTQQKRRVQEYHFHDVETGEPRLAFDVMAQLPGHIKRAAGQPDWYLIARYSDRAAADEHARTGRKPYGYG